VPLDAASIGFLAQARKKERVAQQRSRWGVPVSHQADWTGFLFEAAQKCGFQYFNVFYTFLIIFAPRRLCIILLY